METNNFPYSEIIKRLDRGEAVFISNKSVHGKTNTPLNTFDNSNQ
jgi:hypothetical protein